MILPPTDYETGRSDPVNLTGVRCDSIAAVFRSRPWSFDAHAHADRHQLFWINKGAGRVQIDGFTRGFGPNTIACMPAGTVHGFDFTPVTAGWVITLPVELGSGAELPVVPVLSTVNMREEQASLTGHCDDINREQGTQTAAQDVALTCHGGLLAVWLMRHLIRHDVHPPKGSAARKLLRGFSHLLEAGFHTEHSVGYYADQLMVTPTHLSRVCRQNNGQSANTLIQNRTILEARQRLAFTDQKIVDVARGLGFASAAYFTRLFTSKTGQSPSEFRSAIRQIFPPAGKAPRDRAGQSTRLSP